MEWCVKVLTLLCSGLFIYVVLLGCTVGPEMGMCLKIVLIETSG